MKTEDEKEHRVSHDVQRNILRETNINTGKSQNQDRKLTASIGNGKNNLPTQKETFFKQHRWVPIYPLPSPKLIGLTKNMQKLDKIHFAQMQYTMQEETKFLCSREQTRRNI